jgi:hypothetical protein
MPQESSKILYLRGIPSDISKKLKAAAALSGQSLQVSVAQLIDAHVAALEQKGPRSVGSRGPGCEGQHPFFSLSASMRS